MNNKFKWNSYTSALLLTGFAAQLFIGKMCISQTYVLASPAGHQCMTSHNHRHPEILTWGHPPLQVSVKAWYIPTGGSLRLTPAIVDGADTRQPARCTGAYTCTITFGESENGYPCLISILHYVSSILCLLFPSLFVCYLAARLSMSGARGQCQRNKSPFHLWSWRITRGQCANQLQVVPQLHYRAV